MPHLVLESAVHGSISLNDLVDTRHGVQARPGVTGLGLPPVDVKWRDGAGNGAQFRSRRVLPRDIDIPIYVSAANRAALKAQLATLAGALSDEVALRLVEDDGSSWSVRAHRVGGFDYVYGRDTDGIGDLFTVLTLRAGDPFWESGQEARILIQGGSGGAGLLNGSLVNLNLSTAQTIGNIVIENPGDADCYPTWLVTGPCTSFIATNEAGESFAWNGTLTAGQTLTVNTRDASVKDHTGANRYANLAPAPRLWKLPPGTTPAVVDLDGATAASSVLLTFRPRRWQVI